jgi:hypothetical protein
MQLGLTYQFLLSIRCLQFAPYPHVTQLQLTHHTILFLSIRRDFVRLTQRNKVLDRFQVPADFFLCNCQENSSHQLVLPKYFHDRFLFAPQLDSAQGRLGKRQLFNDTPRVGICNLWSTTLKFIDSSLLA